MPAYIDLEASEFLDTPEPNLVAALTQAYASDGFLSQYTTQSIAWKDSIALLKEAIQHAVQAGLIISDWRVLMELPLYRLRSRIDLVIVTPQAIVVVEIKVGQNRFLSVDLQQVEEYALDLRDFHEHSNGIPILPVLWCTEAAPQFQDLSELPPGVAEPVVKVGMGELGQFLTRFSIVTSQSSPLVIDPCAAKGLN